MRGAPVPPEEYVDEGHEPLTEARLVADGWAHGLDVWEQMGKAYEHYLSYSDHAPSGLDNAQMWSLQQAIRAQAVRGGVVEAWIKEARDQFPRSTGYPESPEWLALDDLLNDYRLHADTGTPLDQEVEGPH